MFRKNITAEFIGLFHLPVEGAGGGKEGLDRLEGSIASLRIDCQTGVSSDLCGKEKDPYRGRLWGSRSDSDQQGRSSSGAEKTLAWKRRRHVAKLTCKLPNRIGLTRVVMPTPIAQPVIPNPLPWARKLLGKISVGIKKATVPQVAAYLVKLASDIHANC